MFTSFCCKDLSFTSLNELPFDFNVFKYLVSVSDFVFISATTSISESIAELAVKSGAIVIDDSSAFRLSEEVPLVIPEINSKDLTAHKGIVSIPNCSTTPLAMVLACLTHQKENFPGL